MTTFRKQLLESIDTFETAKQVAAEWLMGGCDLETTYEKVMENFYFAKKYPDLLKIRTKVREIVEPTVERIQSEFYQIQEQISAYPKESILEETIMERVEMLQEARNKRVSQGKAFLESRYAEVEKSLDKNTDLARKIVVALYESGTVIQELMHQSYDDPVKKAASGISARLGKTIHKKSLDLAQKAWKKNPTGKMTAGLSKVSQFAAKHPKALGRGVIGTGTALAAGGLYAARKKAQKNKQA